MIIYILLSLSIICLVVLLGFIILKKKKFIKKTGIIFSIILVITIAISFYTTYMMKNLPYKDNPSQIIKIKNIVYKDCENGNYFYPLGYVDTSDVFHELPTIKNTETIIDNSAEELTDGVYLIYITRNFTANEFHRLFLIKKSFVPYLILSDVNNSGGYNITLKEYIGDK